LTKKSEQDRRGYNHQKQGLQIHQPIRHCYNLGLKKMDRYFLPDVVQKKVGYNKKAMLIKVDDRKEGRSKKKQQKTLGSDGSSYRAALD
jgi:hypothetical protein